MNLKAHLGFKWILGYTKDWYTYKSSPYVHKGVHISANMVIQIDNLNGLSGDMYLWGQKLG